MGVNAIGADEQGKVVGAVHKFLIHNEGDDVGVAIQDIHEGQHAVGIHMDTDTHIELVATSHIPLSHKIAIKEIAESSDVTEYGVPIGRATQRIALGEYVHTHNVQSTRWPGDSEGRMET